MASEAMQPSRFEKKSMMPSARRISECSPEARQAEQSSGIFAIAVGSLVSRLNGRSVLACADLLANESIAPLLKAERAIEAVGVAHLDIAHGFQRRTALLDNRR